MKILAQMFPDGLIVYYGEKYFLLLRNKVYQGKQVVVAFYLNFFSLQLRHKHGTKPCFERQRAPQGKLLIAP